ncbi:hypothetical protein FRB96_006413 [Tulasnella sp. 330]|nr:hypothetical protein FRB96_006413 [Tulasnella sp. 330]KAG8877593.1 hypothetical protein FRB97_003257 [Tulasnella sp. 331]
MPYDPSNARTKETLDWVFFVSSLNFSFWSQLEDGKRYGVEWYEDGWRALNKPPHQRKTKVQTGYWSLPAAINKALEHGIPVTDPAFYSDPGRCPDSTLASIFASASSEREDMPLLVERIAILRQNGLILLDQFNGSLSGMLDSWKEAFGPDRTALQLVKMVTDAFPSFRDEAICNNRPVYFWKRAQILVAEAWAAFHPSDDSTHPLFPNNGVSQLTMFADYRVPQILHTLQIITYPPSLLSLLQAGALLPYGSEEEMSLRAASILAVERIRECIAVYNGNESVSSVLIDFWLWEMAKKVEGGSATLPGVEPGGEMVPIHLTRSIWY